VATALEIAGSNWYKVRSFPSDQVLNVPCDHQFFVRLHNPDGHGATRAGDNGRVCLVATLIELDAEILQTGADPPSDRRGRRANTSREYEGV
jgi:hypothetical protein